MKYLGQAGNRFNTDGLTDMDKINYKIIERENRSLYTWLLVDVNSTSVVKHIEGLSPKRGRIQSVKIKRSKRAYMYRKKSRNL